MSTASGGGCGTLVVYLAVLWLITAPLWLGFPLLVPGLVIASFMALLESLR